MKKFYFLALFSSFLYASEAQKALEFAKTNELFRNYAKCSENDFNACKKVENYKSDYFDDIKTFTNQRCKEKNIAACYFISHLSDDEDIQHKALMLACQNHFKLACTEIISYFEPRKQRALSILQRQCDEDKNMNSCVQTARFFHAFYDYTKALQYSKKACDKGFLNACVLNASYLRHEGRDADALSMLESTCKKDYEPACFAMAKAHISLGNYTASKEFIKRSCKLGNAASCKELRGF